MTYKEAIAIIEDAEEIPIIWMTDSLMVLYAEAHIVVNNVRTKKLREKLCEGAEEQISHLESDRIT